MTFKLQLVLLLHFLLRFIAPVVVLIGVFFAKKSNRVTTHYGQDPSIQRYVLPDWLSWFNTPDEDGWPMYEPTVVKLYNKYGWRFTMWYNLGTRNVGQGLLWKYGNEVDERVYNEMKLFTKDKPSSINVVWFLATDGRFKVKVWNLGVFKVVFGCEIAHDHYHSHTTTGYYAIPDIGFTK